jgi:hypothetical protein
VRCPIDCGIGRRHRTDFRFHFPIFLSAIFCLNSPNRQISVTRMNKPK